MSEIGQFIYEYAKLVSSHPEMVDLVEEDKNDGFTQIIVKAEKTDAGRLIGKDGNMVNSLKTIVSACKAKTRRSYKILVETKEAAI